MRTNWVGFVVLSVVLVLIGCGGPKSESVDAPKVSARDAIQKALEGIAASGQGGSEIGAMMGEIDKLAAEDAALAKDLKAGAQQLMSMSDSAKVKAKANEMLKKLGGGGGAGSAPK